MSVRDGGEGEGVDLKRAQEGNRCDRRWLQSLSDRNHRHSASDQFSSVATFSIMALLPLIL